MESTFETIGVYLTRVAPGMALGAAMLFLARRQPRLRIGVYLALVVLFRDAMTPLGLWSFGTRGFFWIRLSSDPAFMVLFGLSCLGISAGLYYLDRANQPLVHWKRGPLPAGLLGGLAGAVLVVA